MIQKTGIIYAYTHKPTGRMYVGQTTRPEARHKEHVTGVNAKHQRIDRAFLKYGPEAFSYDVLLSGVPVDELNDWEMFYVWQFMAYGYGFNITPGGEFDSEWVRLIVDSEYWKLRHQAGVQRLAQNPDWIEKVKTNATKKYADPVFRKAKRELMQSKIRADHEWRSRIAESNKAKAADHDFRKKHQAGIDRRSLNAEWKKSVSNSARMRLSKPVICVETSVVYPSAAEASRATGIKGVRSVTSGKQKTAGGYQWEIV